MIGWCKEVLKGNRQQTQAEQEKACLRGKKIFTKQVVKHGNWGSGRLESLSPQRCSEPAWPRPWTASLSCAGGRAPSRELGCGTSRGPALDYPGSGTLDTNCFVLERNGALRYKEPPGRRNKWNHPWVPQRWQNWP